MISTSFPRINVKVPIEDLIEFFLLILVWKIKHLPLKTTHFPFFVCGVNESHFGNALRIQRQTYLALIYLYLYICLYMFMYVYIYVLIYIYIGFFFSFFVPNGRDRVSCDLACNLSKVFVKGIHRKWWTRKPKVEGLGVTPIHPRVTLRGTHLSEIYGNKPHPHERDKEWRRIKDNLRQFYCNVCSKW